MRQPRARLLSLLGRAPWGTGAKCPSTASAQRLHLGSLLGPGVRGRARPSPLRRGSWWPAQGACSSSGAWCGAEAGVGCGCDARRWRGLEGAGRMKGRRLLGGRRKAMLQLQEGWRSCSVPPQPGAALLPFPGTGFLVQPRSERDAGGQGDAGRGSVRAAGSPFWYRGLRGGTGVRALRGRAVGPRGAGTSRDVLVGAAARGCAGLGCGGGRDAQLSVPMAMLWGRGALHGGFGARLWLFYPVAVQGCPHSPPAPPGRAGRDQAGSQRAVSWAGQDPSRAPGKGEEGCGVGRGPPRGQDGGPLESVGAQRGRGGMPVACPRAGA